MEYNKDDCYDMECVDCEHRFDFSEVEVINSQLCCPKCKSEDILDLTDEG